MSTAGFDDAALDAIVEAVVGRVQNRLQLNRSVVPPLKASPAPPPTAPSAPQVMVRQDLPGVHDDLDTAVATAGKAFEELDALSLETRYNIVASMRKVALAHLDEMARRAVEETSLGRVEDKLIKNRVAITKTPGPEFLEPLAMSGDHGLMLLERAAFGVICSITPCTNPTETIINNGIGMVSAGNAVVYNVHPLAKKTSAWYIGLLNQAIADAGGPRTPLLNCLAEPTIASAQGAMRHKGVRLVVVTGGGAVVTPRRAATTRTQREPSIGSCTSAALIVETSDDKPRDRRSSHPDDRSRAPARGAHLRLGQPRGSQCA